MALKDLISKQSALTEEVIEKIISDYVRYDADEKVIILMPASTSLSNRAKILIYLVALQGWPHVTDESVPLDAKPGELEERLGIPGGTLRPTLKELKDTHVIAEAQGRYFVRPTTMHLIEREISGQNTPFSQHVNKARKRNTKSAKIDSFNSDETQDVTNDNPKPEGRKSPGKKTGGLAEKFRQWIKEGYFKEAKTLADVQKRFHREGLIVSQTSIPGYLLKAVRSQQLERDEAEINKKRVWVYKECQKR